MEQPKIPAAAETGHSAWRPTPGPKSVFVATPCDDGHRLDFWRSLLELERANMRRESQHRLRIIPGPGDSLVPRARNNYAWQFYHHTADDYLCFLDSDLDFRPKDIFRLVDHNLPIVGGKYAIKEPDLRWCINGIPGHVLDPKTMLQPVAALGTGCILIHRYVIGTLIAECSTWNEWRVAYRADEDPETVRHDLFWNGVIDDPEWMPHSPRYLSEDWGFCYYARKHGFTVTLDHGCILLHEGAIKYPLQARRLSREEMAAGFNASHE